MPAPHWFFRFMYDRGSAAWERRRDEPEHRERVERTADELATVVAPPGPVADLGCGPGAHALALARRGYDVVGVDGSPRMVEVIIAGSAPTTVCYQAIRRGGVVSDLDPQPTDAEAGRYEETAGHTGISGELVAGEDTGPD